MSPIYHNISYNKLQYNMDNEYELITIPEQSRPDTPDSLPPLEDITECPQAKALEQGMKTIYDNINKLLGEYAQDCLGEHAQDCLGEHAQDCLGEHAQDCLGEHANDGQVEKDEFATNGPEPIDYVLDDIRTDMQAEGVDPKIKAITREYLSQVCEDLRLHYDLYYGKYKSLKMPAMDNTVYWLNTIIESCVNPAPKLTAAVQRTLCRDILKRIHRKGSELPFVELFVVHGNRVGYEPVTGCSDGEQTRGIMEICVYVREWLDTNADYLIWL